MIQVFAYRETHNGAFLQKHLTQYSNHALLFKNIEEDIKKLPEEERYNLHFTLAHCEPGTRTFRMQDLISFDLDHIDTTKIDDYIKTFFKTFKGLDKDKTVIVSSGHGLHFHIQVHPFEAEHLEAFKPHYLGACKLLSDAITKAGLPCDDKTVDKGMLTFSKTLRLPGTINRKEGLPDTNCTLIQPNLELQDWELVDIAPIHERMSSLKAYPKPDTNAVLSCPFLEHARTNASTLSEPEWYAMLTIVSRLENGIELAHTYSQPHPQYKREACDYKIKHALEDAGPRTCQAIEELWNGCKSCPHHQKVISPIMIKGPDHIATEHTGYHTLVGKNGELLKSPRPEYHDLEKAFRRDHPYVVMAENKGVYLFNGTHWEPFYHQQVKAYAESHFDPRPKETHRVEFLNLICANNLVTTDWFSDNATQSINLANGVLDLRTMELRPHSKDYGHRYVLDYNYDPTAQCPTFNEMMKNITCHRLELENILLEFIGFGLAGHQCDPPKALLLVGEGANGKSTFLHMIQDLVGEQAYATVDLDQLTKDTSRYSLVGKLFNIAEEVSYKGMDASKEFKALTAGGSVTVRQLYSDEFSYRSRCKFIFACNDLPRTNDLSNGMMRRLLIVPFQATFNEKVADRKIEQKLHAERPGILNRVLSAYQRFLISGNFTESEVVSNQLEQYKVSNDTVEQWRLECLQPASSEDFISTQKLYEHYLQWCKDAGLKFPDVRQKWRLKLNKIYGQDSFKSKRMPDKKVLQALFGVKFTENIDVVYQDEHF